MPEQHPSRRDMSCWKQAWLGGATRRFAQLVVLCAVSTGAGPHLDGGVACPSRASSTVRTLHLFHQRHSFLRLRGGERAADHGEEGSDTAGRDPPPWRETTARAPKVSRKTTAREKKKKRESGLDWETFRRKARDGAPKDNSAYDPYFEGVDGNVYQVRTNDGKNSHAVIVKPPKRGKWAPKKVLQRETQAAVDAMLANLDEETVYVDGGPTGELGVQAGSGAPLRRHTWERYLFPQLREAVENERKGLQFTGQFEDRGRIAVPTYTDKNYTIELITGDHIPLPFADERAPTIAEQEAQFKYSRKGEPEPEAKSNGAEGGGVQKVGAGGGGSGTKVVQDEDTEEEEGERAVLMIREAAKNRNQTLIEHLAELRSQAVKLSKAKRYIKHVMGFSQEALQRMVNGTQTTDSAWGPHKVIRGTSDSKEGDVWGSRAPAGRKRRDAEWFRERAIKGNDKAQLQLGLAYMEGAGVPRNESRGAGWLARSARQGNLRAMHELALCYEFGEGVRRSNSSAVQLLKQAARKGFMRAQEDLGVAHMDGRLGLPPDARKALPGLRLAAQGGSRRAHTRLGVVFAEGRDGVERDETQAEMHLQKAARSYRTGHLSGNSAAGSEVREGARALYKLAKRFLDGKGVRQDHFKAVDWAARSSIKGYTPATLMLADCYSAGLGVPRDEKIALRCYRNAALRGDSRGAVEMSKRLLLLSRQENDEDKAKEARRWLHMTALDGDSEAACLLAYCWVNGTGGDQDAGEARRLFLQAATAENPSPDAQFQLAIRSGADGAVDPLLLKDTHDASGGGVGGGVLQVWSSGAEALLRAAADGGHLEAMYSLGKWLVEGRSGVVVEDARMEGVEWLRKAGEAGSALGMARLGKCFAEGIGVEKDEEEAALWISRGRDGGEDADMEWVLDAAQRGVLEAKRLVAAVMLEGGEEEEAAGGKVVVLPSGERVTRAIAETIKELAELGDAESMYRYGAWLAEAGDGAGRSRGLAMLEEAAEDKECGEAMSILGQAHARGLYGLMPSDTEAVRWFAQGAEAGLSEAQFKLGAMYEHARGVPRDMFMAAEWYSEAAEQGHADAAFALGVCYARGRGIKKDHEMAVYWYSRAAHLGHGRAQFNLALRYADGALAGVKKDPHLATKWFKAAIANGIKGPNVKLKNGVLQNFAKLEMRQELVDTPKTHDAHGGAKKAERTRVMKMSAYKAIRWNRNPSSYRNGAQSLGIILRSEGKKVPRFVEIDDPKAKDFGRLYPTRPDMESREKILSTLLVAHGTNWEEMAVDGRNHLEWDVGRLRKGCVSMMEKRLKYPPAYFDKAERQQIPRFGKLLKSYKAERAAKKARVEETAAILAANDGDNRLRIRALDRREQLQSARALAVLQIPGLDTRALLTGGRKGKSTIKHEGQGVQAIAGIAVEEVLRLNYLPTDDEDGDYLPAFEEQGTERGGETLQLEGGITEHDGVLDEIWDEEGNVVSRAGDEEEGGALVTRGDEEGAALVAGDAKEGGRALVAGGGGVGGGALVAVDKREEGAGETLSEEEDRPEKGFEGEEATWVDESDVDPTDICAALAGVGAEGLCRTGKRLGTPRQILVGGAKVWIPTFAALG